MSSEDETSEMTRDDFKELKTKLVFADKLETLVGEYSSINDACMPILLPDNDLKAMFSPNKEELTQNISKMTDIPRIKSLLFSAYGLYEKENDKNPQHLNSITFSILLLYQCGFDSYPLKISYNETHRLRECVQPQEIFVMAGERLLLFITTEEHGISSFTENENISILMHSIASKLNQIMHDKCEMLEKQYPIYVYALSIIGTKFHFYRGIATREYIKDDIGYFEIIKYATLDFMNTYNRREIFIILTYIKEKSLELVQHDLKFTN